MFATWKEAAEAKGWNRVTHVPGNPLSGPVLYHEETGDWVPDGDWEAAARESGIEEVKEGR